MISGTASAPRTPDVMTIEEAAAYLRVCTKTLRKQIKANVIPATRVGNQYRIERRALMSFLASGKQGGC